MTQRIFVALLTVVVFGAGYVARGLTQSRESVPPAPAALAKEYPRADGSGTNKKSTRELDRAKLLVEIQKLRPQIEAYSAQVEEINSEFDREFFQLLNAEQRDKFVANQKRSAEREAKRLADRTPLSDEDIQRKQEGPLTFIYWMVTVTPRLEWLTKEYALDANQQGSVRALLSLRRNKFIALLDATPHPNIRLSRLAPLMERVATPAK